jgi:AcrR family transcriptional regulator
MDVLSRKGFANTSIADLSDAAGVDPSTLSRNFGNRDDILRTAIRSCAEIEASLAQEPLRTAPNGKQAILSMLEENVRLRRHWPRYCGCLFTLNAFVVPHEDVELQHFLSDRRGLLAKQIRVRVSRSIRECELPGDADIEAITNLCFTVLSGLTFRVLDGARPAHLFRCIDLFVNSLGFRSEPAKRKNLKSHEATTR